MPRVRNIPPIPSNTLRVPVPANKASKPTRRASSRSKQKRPGKSRVFLQIGMEHIGRTGWFRPKRTRGGAASVERILGPRSRFTRCARELKHISGVDPMIALG
jgi:hypothetical protein